MAKHSETILVIDDEEPICLLLKWILKREFNVITYNSGIDALMWLKEGNIPCMIITDIKMPNFDGIDFVKGLKKSGIYRDIPIILLSGSIEDEKQKDGMDAGAFAYIRKPFDPDNLKQAIKKGINRTSTNSLIKDKN